MTHMWKEILEQPETLRRCRDVNEQTVRRIVEAAGKRNIRQVVIAARGTSDHAAVYGKYVIELLLGIPVSLAAPSVFTVYRAPMHLENCLVIGISQSGRAADVLEVLRSAQASGAVTVGITNDAGSEIALAADHFLDCAAGTERSVAATKTFSSQIYLLASLAAAWSGDENVMAEVRRIPEEVSRVFGAADLIARKAERYCFMNECFVLARGVNYAVSLEAALKIQETTYIRAKAFATSDFQHGPIAMIEKDIPVIVFAPDGPSLGDVESMIRRLRRQKIETIVISNKKEILDLGTTAFPIPETSSDILSPFFNAIIAQMFACRLALAKGLNPDKPRSLHKITITK